MRPTSDRVREALFSILGQRVVEARVLDAFSGSGALGLEALSRGAAEIVFVEADRVAAEILEQNVRELGVTDRCRIFRADVLATLDGGAIGGSFDLVFADPPYGTDLAERFMERIGAGDWLSRRGWLIVEREAAAAPAEPAPEGLGHLRSARYGDTRLDLFALAPPT